MVLVITMLMMALLTVLASAAVMRTSLDLREGSAQRIEAAAYQVSESGTLGAVGLAATMQGGLVDYVGEKANSTLTSADMGSGLLQLTGVDGSFGTELAAIGKVDFATKVSPPDLSAAVPGYDASRYCFQTYHMVTTSQIGAVKAAGAAEAALQGQAAIATEVTVGPVVCNP